MTFLRVWMSLVFIAWEIGARIRQADKKKDPPSVIWSRDPKNGVICNVCQVRIAAIAENIITLIANLRSISIPYFLCAM